MSEKRERYFHGGAPHLRIGDVLLPPIRTGAPSLSEFGAAGIHRRDRVYLTTDYDTAVMYAAMHWSGRGAVYEAVPEGGVLPDPDCLMPDLSFECASARIVGRKKVPGKMIRKIQRYMLEAS